MSLRCLLDFHDWEHINDNAERVCLRCRRHQVTVSVGGGWGGWEDITEVKAAAVERSRRQMKAKRIARRVADTSADGAA